jgi:hypothetical protein
MTSRGRPSATPPDGGPPKYLLSASTRSRHAQKGSNDVMGHFQSFTVLSLPSHESADSTLGLRQGKLPRAVEDCRSRTEEANRVIPSLRDWETILRIDAAPAELNGD